MDDDEDEPPVGRYSGPRERPVFEEKEPEEKEKSDSVFGEEEMEEIVPEEMLFGEELPDGMSIEEGEED